ncbi:MAG: DUF1836 domain-containing protein [Ruminococcaceae bacterium]|nr:DUF1836 domain-containing protein [Oscillospiraceae bacterium]
MNEEIRTRLKTTVADYRLPRYSELPNVGLYLEQVAKYINGFLEPIGCSEITTSMISNYVKKGYIPSPEKKQYYSDHIAHLIVIAITKNVLSLDNIHALFLMQREMYTVPVAYDYFCMELENMIAVVFGVKKKPDMNIGVTNTELKDFLRNVIISVSHSVYLASCFAEMNRMKNNK